jgi:aspartate racemase
MNQSLGILGGLGPLASAEFLKTIYEFNLTILEQDSPTCILYSDPTFPDRTDAILGGSDEVLISLLVKSLESLCQLGVSKIVIACITMHYFLPQVPVPLRKRVISLIDLILEEVSNTEKPHLLLCTKGAQKAGIFQKHKQWKLVEPYILFPSEDDQNLLQTYIYQIKINCNKDSIVDYLDNLADKYEVDSLVAGCTELHLLKKHLMNLKYSEKGYHFVDPLITIAKDLNRFMVV